MTNDTIFDPAQKSTGVCDSCGEVRDSLVYFDDADLYICREKCMMADYHRDGTLYAIYGDTLRSVPPKTAPLDLNRLLVGKDLRQHMQRNTDDPACVCGPYLCDHCASLMEAAGIADGLDAEIDSKN